LKFFRIPSLLALLAGGTTICMPAAHAQPSGAFGGYTLGFVYDSRVSGLRPLSGIPGAAVLGAPLDIGEPVRQAYVAPRQNYAIALTDTRAVSVQFISTAEPPVVTPLGFDPVTANVVALSADGSAGAFYSRDEALIRVVTGLPGAPVIARSVPVGAVSGKIGLLSISNDAAVLAVAVDTSSDDARSGSVILLDENGNGQVLASSTHISALQFLGDAHDLLVADDSDNTLSVIQGLPQTTASTLVADGSAGLAGPIGLNTYLDGNLVIANGGASNVLVLDPGGAQIGSYPCPVAPSRLTRLNGKAVFLLNGISNDDPLWLFDGDSETPRVMFIPVEQVGSPSVAQ
jgi:hypothetical protein